MAEKDSKELTGGVPERRPAEAPAYKQYLLLGFLAISVVLVVLIWADNLIEDSGGQGFVRATPIIVTLEPGATYPPHEEHKNGKENSPSTGEATSTPAALTTEEAPAATPRPTRDSGDIGWQPAVGQLALSGVTP